MRVPICPYSVDYILIQCGLMGATVLCICEHIVLLGFVIDTTIMLVQNEQRVVEGKVGGGNGVPE